MSKTSRYDTLDAQIQQSMTDAQFDRAKRTSLLKKLQIGNLRAAAMYYMRRDRAITSYEVLPFQNMLASISTGARDLDLIVVSNGGDGNAAETILGICRRYFTGTLRVVVPLYAKSAATLLALGGDEILMGENSELGPIDAQVETIQDNAPQQISADHFLRAHSEATTNLGSNDPSQVMAAQIQLAQLSPAFLQYCQDLMTFAKDMATKQLKNHMFQAECAKDGKTWKKRIDQIADNLLSSSTYLTHGRLIGIDTIRESDDLKHLKVTELDPKDDYTQCLNELLMRTEIVAHRANVGKWLFSEKFQMLGD